MTLSIVPVLRHYDWGLPFQQSMISLFSDSGKNQIVAEAWWQTETFLLKLISVGRPLSIQVHPDKKRSHQLHENHPDRYGPREKPEIALALTPFSALCGFLSWEEMCGHLRHHPVLAHLLNIDKKNDIQEAFLTMLAWNDKPLHTQEVLEDVRMKMSKKGSLTQVDEWVMTLMDKFPHDIAALSPFFLRLVHASPFSAIVIPAGCPHCYLEGQAVECMPNSDNVVRSGLTSKPCDLDLFQEILNDGDGYEPALIGHSALFSHPCFSEYFHLVLVERNANVPNPHHRAVALILQGVGMINKIPCTEGSSWQCHEDEIVLEGNMRVVIAVSNQ